MVKAYQKDITTRHTRYVWYIVDIVIFLAVNGLAIWYLWPLENVGQLLSPWNILLLGLATYRLSHLIAAEAITRPLREPFVTVKVEGNHIVEEPKYYGFVGALGRLISCPSCVGVWVAAFLIYAYVLAPTLFWVLLLISVLSALERIISILTLVGRTYTETQE